MNTPATNLDWDKSASVPEAWLADSESMFRQLFKRSADAMVLSDPYREVFVDCNQAAVAMMRASSEEQLLMKNPADLSPEFQADGRSSRERVHEDTALALSQGTHRFEWRARRMDGTEFPLDVLLTRIQIGERTLVAAVCRDVTEQKRAQRELLHLTQTLERRVNERTVELAASEARFRALVEHASEAIVVYSVDTGRFLFGNQHACDLYGVPMSKLPELSPADVSPEFQPCGRRTSDLVHEKTREVLDGGISVFEWVHRQPNGRLIPAEVRLLRLPAEGQNLVRASIIDNTERKRAERTLRDSEAKFRALFEGASQGVVLHDEHEILEVNPAAVRILGLRRADEILGRHPGEFSPPVQPNGESSDALTRQHIEECLAKGSSRFDWVACDPNGREIPLEVNLTRIEWSGREVIQSFITDTSERKRAERALRISEAKFRGIFEASSQGVLLRDESQFLEVNPAAVRILRRQSAHEILGKHPIEFSAPFQPNGERSDLLARRYTDECMSKGSVQFEWVACDPAGAEIPLEVSLTRIELSGRQLIQGFISDITERQRAQATLAESEARFSTAFHASQALLSIFNANDGRIELVNDAYLNWLGYARQEVLGRTCLELGLWENTGDRDSVVKDIQTTGSIRQKECRWRNRRGECSTILLSLEPIKVNGTLRMLSTAVDITQRKRAEEKLRESEARLRESEAQFGAAFRASPVFITIARMDDGRYVLANDAFLKWTGYRLNEVLGHDSQELGLWADPAEHEPFWQELRRTRSIHEREVRARDRHGKIITMLLSADIIEIHGVSHLLTVGLDISQRKQVEAELHRTAAREKELSQLKSNFVSMVSHEFRTPLGIIQSSAELLRDFYLRMQPAERDEQLESISRNARRMAGMMEEVLVLSRLDAGKLEFQPGSLDLNLFSRRIVDEVLSATNRRCSIELSVNSIPAKAQADERLLGHIFTNLLSNALKYSEPGATVHFRVERDGHEAVCVTRDCGIGISEEDQQRLFIAFHRGSNVGTRPGTGLGLLLVKRCAELHGGKVELSSKIGEGTIVTVRFPAF